MFLIAHQIRSLHNVGSIFRSAEAFGVEKLYLTGYTGIPPRPEIAKVALGSQHRMTWEYQEDILSCLRLLKETGVRLVGLDNINGAVSILDVSIPEPFALILGNETDGIEPEVLHMCDAIVCIPLPGHKQSLNVSVAAGIALFALRFPSR